MSRDFAQTKQTVEKLEASHPQLTAFVSEYSAVPPAANLTSARSRSTSECRGNKQVPVLCQNHVRTNVPKFGSRSPAA